MEYNFEWDPTKAATNARKHGVTFDQAVGVFRDPMALSLYEADDSAPGENRWVTLGLIEGQHCLVVVHTYKTFSNSVTIRIISARRATRHEIKQYEQG